MSSRAVIIQLAAACLPIRLEATRCNSFHNVIAESDSDSTRGSGGLISEDIGDGSLSFPDMSLALVPVSTFQSRPF
jgi:hypothetical protein